MCGWAVVDLIIGSLIIQLSLTSEGFLSFLLEVLGASPETGELIGELGAITLSGFILSPHRTEPGGAWQLVALQKEEEGEEEGEEEKKKKKKKKKKNKKQKKQKNRKKNLLISIYTNSR